MRSSFDAEKERSQIVKELKTRLRDSRREALHRFVNEKGGSESKKSRNTTVEISSSRSQSAIPFPTGMGDFDDNGSVSTAWSAPLKRDVIKMVLTSELEKSNFDHNLAGSIENIHQPRRPKIAGIQPRLLKPLNQSGAISSNEPRLDSTLNTVSEIAPASRPPTSSLTRNPQLAPLRTQSRSSTAMGQYRQTNNGLLSQSYNGEQTNNNNTLTTTTTTNPLSSSLLSTTQQQRNNNNLKWVQQFSMPAISTYQPWMTTLSQDFPQHSFDHCWHAVNAKKVEDPEIRHLNYLFMHTRLLKGAGTTKR